MIEYVRSFINWGARSGATVLLNELGWPYTLSTADVAQWNRANKQVMKYCNSRGVGVIGWDVGEMRRNYPFAMFQPVGTNFTPLAASMPNAPPWEAFLPNAASPLSGVYMNSAAQNAVWGNDSTTQFAGQNYQQYFSNVNRGTKGAQYTWDSATSFAYLYSRGVRCVVIGFRWERLQPVLGIGGAAPFDATYQADLVATVNAAIAAGLRVIIQPFNKGAYYIDNGGSPSYGVRNRIGVDAGCTNAHFNDMWTKLVALFISTPGVVAYGLMNEPAVGSITPWQNTTQSAVDTIRALGDNRTIIVNVLTYQSASSIAAAHPTPWVSDAQNKIIYGVSVYWDGGNYTNTYDTLKQQALSGYGLSDDFVGDVNPLVSGARAPTIGEFTWLSSNIKITGGQVAPVSSASAELNGRSMLPNGISQMMVAAWDTVTASRETWLTFRKTWDQNFNYWRFGISGTTWYLQKLVAGSFTTVNNSKTTGTVPQETNQLVEVEVSGPYIDCYVTVSGVRTLVYSTVDSHLQGSSMMGVAFSNAPNARIEWFRHKLNLKPRGLYP